MNIKRTALGAAVLIASSAATAEVSLDEMDVSVGGFIRADYGNGDRYPDDQGNDRLGVTRSALAVTSAYQNVKGVFVVGTEVTSEADGTTDGDVDIKDAFIVIDNIGNSGITISAGAQPLLFGLKPNGYPFDHSIQASVEYGTGGGLAVANQAGPSLIASMNLGNVEIRAGAFDLESGSSDIINQDGSSITDNLFVQAYARDILGTGFYGVVGFESLFVDTENDGEGISTVGLGWKNERFDVSAELISLDETINATNGDETYTVVEASFKPTDKTNIYADYSKADEADFETIRTGFNYDYNKHTMFTVEYSKDEIAFGEDVDSIDFRITLSF